MKLYYSPGACSLSPHIVLNELDLPYELERVDLKTHTTSDGTDYYLINPKGYVPALELDGELLTEGPAIVQYLADKKPEAGLIPPAGTLERARVHEWLTYIGTEIHKRFGPLITNGSEDAQAQAREQLAGRFAYAAQKLANRDYLLGSHLTVADCYLFVVSTWAEKTGVPIGDNLRAFIRRMSARPAVHRALQEEGLVP